MENPEYRGKPEMQLGAIASDSVTPTHSRKAMALTSIKGHPGSRMVVCSGLHRNGMCRGRRNGDPLACGLIDVGTAQGSMNLGEVLSQDWVVLAASAAVWPRCQAAWTNNKLVRKQQNDAYNDLVDAVADGVLQGAAKTGYTVQYSGAAGAAEDFARRYVVGRFAGMPIYTDANIAIASNAAKGGVFTKRAVVYAQLWDIEVEPEKDASLRATELNGTMCYAYAERTDTWGVELNLGATAPTA